MAGTGLMAQQTPIRRWSTTLAAVVAAVLASMVWVDRPVASFVSVHTRPLRLLRWTVELHRWADEAH